MILLINLDNNNAAQNSNRGNEIIFKGATFEFAHINLIECLPSEFIHRKNKQQPFTSIFTSENP